MGKGERTQRGLLTAFACIAIAMSRADAQELRGTILDSVARKPIAGAVVLLTDGAGTTLRRAMSNERGEYGVVAPPATRTVRVQRLGYRPRQLDMPDAGAGSARLDVAMVRIPTLLESITVKDAPTCPRRSDRPAALALYEQARAGLLAAVVARETNPASMKLIGFERVMDGSSDRVIKQSVRLDSSDGRTKSFSAVNSAAGFVSEGFARDSAGNVVLFGPDADVLLDEAFASGYCFHVERDRRRANQLGLGFVAANRRRGRVDIEGTLWIDTVARTLVEVDYAYVGLKRIPLAPTPGGRISFREMPNGAVIIDRWYFRMTGQRADTAYTADGKPRVHAWFISRQAGGEVARATWPDGQSWRASLGRFQLRLLDHEGRPVTRVTVRLAGTDYIASPDPFGDIDIPDLLPGPYSVTLVNESLASARMSVGTTVKFVASRDSLVRARLTPPSESDLAALACVGDTARVGSIVGKIEASDGSPVTDALWELGSDFGNSTEFVALGGSADAYGHIHFCPLATDEEDLHLRVWRASDPSQILSRRVDVKRGESVTFRHVFKVPKPGVPN